MEETWQSAALIMSENKIYEHDVESYVITIRRKGAVASAPVVAAPVTEVQKFAPTVKKQEAASGRAVVAPLPGVIVGIKVSVGDVVKTGQVLAVLEAMKMENDIQAEFDGTVTAVNVVQGDSVLEGAVLVIIS